MTKEDALLCPLCGKSNASCEAVALDGGCHCPTQEVIDFNELLAAIDRTMNDPATCKTCLGDGILVQRGGVLSGQRLACFTCNGTGKSVSGTTEKKQ